MKNLRKFESEVSTGNMSGKAGIPSIPFGRGYYQSGANNGAFGIEFTPSSEPSFKTYKSMKHSKKNLKNKMKRIKKFEQFILESIDYGSIDVEFNGDSGFVIMNVDGKNKREYFKILPNGYVHFETFYPEHIYYDLVEQVYNKMSEGELKDKIFNNYQEVFNLIEEDATATAGNTGGMGNVVSAQPSSIPGDVAGGTKGSGDIGSGKAWGPYMKTPAGMKKGKKKKKKLIGQL